MALEILQKPFVLYKVLDIIKESGSYKDCENFYYACGSKQDRILFRKVYYDILKEKMMEFHEDPEVWVDELLRFNKISLLMEYLLGRKDVKYDRSDNFYDTTIFVCVKNIIKKHTVHLMNDMSLCSDIENVMSTCQCIVDKEVLYQMFKIHMDLSYIMNTYDSD